MGFKDIEVGRIPREWEVLELINKVEITMGQSPKSEYYNENGKGIPFMQGRKTFGDKYHEIDTWCTDPKRLANKGDVLMSVRAPVGDVNIAKMDLCIGRGLASLRMKNGNNEYLYYLLKNYVDMITSRETGTVFASINKAGLETLRLPFPLDKEQKAIAHILSTLDEKIETNNQINKTLEKMAQTIFKHWFVDFEFPNENGEPYKSSGGEMIESELGMIPKGWKVVEIDELCEQIKPGTNYQPKRTEKGIPFLNVRNINKGYIDVTDVKYILEDDYRKVHSSWIPEKNDVLISRIGTLGLVSVIRERNLPLAVHYNFIDIKSNKVSHQYLYFMLKSDFFQQQYHGIKKASVQEYVTIDEVKRLKMIIPSSFNDYLKLEEVFNCLFNKIDTAQEESSAIINLRDLLLPKLMSGEIRVPLEGVDIS